MQTEKRNQHYIPKFYLRNFSYLNNKKQIGVFNLKNQLFINVAKLKTQGSKNFYYGSDGKVEDGLSKIEGILAETIRTIIEKKELPKRNSDEHLTLLYFIVITDLRNPVKIEGFKKTLQAGKEKLSEEYPHIDIEKTYPEINHDELIQIFLSNATYSVDAIKDLEFKLLINRTKKPFITSDFPIVKYNQLLELKKWMHSKSGYATIGLQIFIPLNSELLLVFYDSGIYKIGNKKQKNVEIKSEQDVHELNTLQFINCFETVFFNEKATKIYLEGLFEKSQKYSRANNPSAELANVIINGNEERNLSEKPQKNLLVFGASDCETNMKVNFIKLHSNGKTFQVKGNSVALPRKATRREGI